MSIERYGKVFPEGTSDFDIELFCYGPDARLENTGGRLTRWEHFRNAVDIRWNRQGSTRRFIWNEWSDRMLKAMIYNKYSALAGAGSSGKSDAMAIFLLIEWLSAPTQTLCLVLSTTLLGARKRIWKSVTEFWNAAEAMWLAEGVQPPGKLVDSKGLIVGMDLNGKWSESLGLTLIAADKDNEKEAAKKLKGVKPPSDGGRLRGGFDELSDLGESVLTAMLGNLNTTDFKAVGAANPGSKRTPFGKFCEPKEGWNSIAVGDETWITKYGVCLSFDATKSPRIMTPQHERPDGSHALYPWMPGRQAIDQMRTAFGEDSLEYWAQVRGFFCPMGMERTVWSELELMAAVKPVDRQEWDMGCELVTAAAMDPAFVTGGDRSPVMWAEFGTISGKKVMNILGYRIVSEGDDSKGAQKLSVTEHAIDRFREICAANRVVPRRAGFDSTGGGVVFGQWLHTKWSHAVIGVGFGEAPVERRADSLNEETIYANRVTQLWVQPKALVREGQIRGIPEDVVDELCLRKWHEKRHTANKACVETKPDMKKRLGKSPDLGDTFCILVEVAIQNGLLDIVEIRKDDRRVNKSWKTTVMTGMDQKRFGPARSIVATPTSRRLSFSKTIRR